MISNVSQGNVIDLILRTAGTKMYEKNFKEESISICCIDVVLYTKFRG